MSDATDDTKRPMPEMDDATRIAVEAAAFRRLRAHLLHDRSNVQNIDLMNLAGFCRNCLSRWYGEAAGERGVSMTKEAAREAFYGMSYDAWRALHQKEASDVQKSDFAASFAANVGER